MGQSKAGGESLSLIASAVAYISQQQTAIQINPYGMINRQLLHGGYARAIARDIEQRSADCVMLIAE